MAMKKRKKNRKDLPSKIAGRGKGNGLTDLETEIMQIVWRGEPVTAAEVREALRESRPLALTTVITVMERLRKKGAIHAVPTIERSRRYSASVAKEAVADNLLANLMCRFFDDSPASLVAHIMGREPIDEAELKAIRKQFRNSKKRGEGR